MIAKAKLWVGLAGAVVLALAATNGFTAWKVNAAAYARGVRDNKIVNIGATEVLNAALDASRAKATNAALDFEMQARELTDLERRLADERAKDPLGGGSCITDDGWMRYFSVTP